MLKWQSWGLNGWAYDTIRAGRYAVVIVIYDRFVFALYFCTNCFAFHALWWIETEPNMGIKAVLEAPFWKESTRILREPYVEGVLAKKKKPYVDGRTTVQVWLYKKGVFSGAGAN